MAAYFFFVLLVLVACKKQDSVSSGKQQGEFVQQLSGNIAGKPVTVSNTMNQNREILKGSFSVISYAQGQTRQMYNIDVAIPALDGNISTKSTLKIQLEHIKPGILISPAMIQFFNHLPALLRY